MRFSIAVAAVTLLGWTVSTARGPHDADFASWGVAPPHQIAFTRVFPNAGQIGLFIAAADGSDERPLFDAAGFDYDATWSPDGASIVYTSDREGSPDLFRIKPDGTGRERLTDDPAYDDQAAFSPDGTQLAFVSTRNGGYARIWTMDLQIATREGGHHDNDGDRAWAATSVRRGHPTDDGSRSRRIAAPP